VEIADSARKHQATDGFDDADIVHVIENALFVADDGNDPDKALYLGPDRAARLPEVVVAVRDDGSEIVIHALKMRRSYEQLLQWNRGDHAR
jgi:hypothetical protein